MLCVYVGCTTQALIQHLRKHFTTALAHKEDNRFHELLCTTDLAEWVIVPLEIVWNGWDAAIAERYWWDKDRRWCLNDMPPGVPHEGSKPSKMMPQGAVQVIRNLTATRQAQDFPRIAALNREVALLTAELQLPPLIPAVVCVRYMTGRQKVAVSRVINSMLRRVQCTTWERQVLRGRIRVVRTVPHTVHQCFEYQANKCEKQSAAPACFCTAVHLSI